eukprot:6447760-Prymnesium_polylepis.1
MRRLDPRAGRIAKRAEVLLREQSNRASSGQGVLAAAARVPLLHLPRMRLVPLRGGRRAKISSDH